jgi:hypothetical protein
MICNIITKHTSYLFEKSQFPGIRCIASHNIVAAKAHITKVHNKYMVVGITPANKVNL